MEEGARLVCESVHTRDLGLKTVKRHPMARRGAQHVKYSIDKLRLACELLRHEARIAVCLAPHIPTAGACSRCRYCIAR